MEGFLNFTSLFFFAFSFFLCLSVITSPTEAQTRGFSVDLIHRDSPKSPFYNSNETSYQRLRNAVSGSAHRLNHFKQALDSSKVTAQTDIIPNGGIYLMPISVGTPPFKILAVADTGSDVIWTQCSPPPCPLCYKQDAPIFNPQTSSTYRNLPCSSAQCASLNQKTCSAEKICGYSVSYGDRSFTNGFLATETITLGSTSGQPVALSGTTFGCGKNNSGRFNSKTNGIVGLGGGPLSLVSQLGASIAGKFSYCLVRGSSTKLNFGTNGVVAGNGVVSSPLHVRNPNTFYFLTLEAISVGNQRLGIVSGTGPGGDIIIDSGTTLTLLPQGVNSKLLSVIQSLIDAQPVQDPLGQFDLCYTISSLSRVPKITMNFKGADLNLNTVNYLVRVGDDTACYAFQSSGAGGLAIYGNVMQTNFLVGYDLQQKTVSFKPTDCTKQ